MYMVITNKIDLLTTQMKAMEEQMKISSQHVEDKINSIEERYKEKYEYIEHLFDETMVESNKQMANAFATALSEQLAKYFKNGNAKR